MVAPPILIVPWSKAWVARFEEERARIAEALADLSPAIEHIGSTAVEGLAAKPVIDIMVGVGALSAAEERVSRLESLGYLHRTDLRHLIPERLFFQRGAPEDLPSGGDVGATHHLHLVEKTSDFWERQLLFRAALRERAELRQAYLGLKQALTLQFGADRIGYANAKSVFIEAAIDSACKKRK